MTVLPGIEVLWFGIVTKRVGCSQPCGERVNMSGKADRWSKIVACGKCERNNPANILLCLNCGERFAQRKSGWQSPSSTIESEDVETNPFRVRPYTRANAFSPFIAQRNPEEIQQAMEVIRGEAFFSWDADGQEPDDLTDAMIAAAAWQCAGQRDTFISAGNAAADLGCF